MRVNKKEMLKKAACTAAVAAVALCAMTACNKPEKTTSENTKLKYWMPLTSNVALYASNFGETEIAKELQKATGVDLEFIHPPQGQESEKFSIMLASTDLPDIIEYNWISYPGGPAKAIKEGVIIDIAKHKDKATNLFGYLDKNSDIMKMASTDDNQIFSFPFIKSDESLCFSSGLIIREDWLKELNLDLPETIDEWETVLTDFKDKKDAIAPYSALDMGYFSPGFDATKGLYLEGTKVKYGVLDSQFKDFLVKMNDWYKKGLIDQSFTTIDGKIKETNILNGYSGATSGSIGSGIGKWMASSKIEGYSLVGAPVPVVNKGEKAKFGAYQSMITPTTRSFAAISTSCKDVASAIKVLDYGYGEKGRMLFNFGIEGKSYEMKVDYPTYTDEIVNNPEGKAMTVALSNYARSYDAGPFIQDKRYMEQYASLPQQKQAWEIWSDTDAAKHTLPNLYVKNDELNEYAQLSTDITTYTDEMISKFIIGAEPLENYDAMLEQLHKRGVDRYIELMQSAYDRYLAR